MIKKYNAVFALWPEYIIEIGLLLDQKKCGSEFIYGVNCEN